MNKKGKNRFKLELEKFISARLRPNSRSFYAYHFFEDNRSFSNVEDRFSIMNIIWDEYESHWEEIVDFPQLSNHEICHEMFWNAFRGRSKMYIQIQDLKSYESNFSNIQNKEETITLQCSLLTLQMLDYDLMMFRAMANTEDEEYRKAALKHYRPYLFDYIAEIKKDTYEQLRSLQENYVKSSNESSLKENEGSPYLWMECAFKPDKNCSHVDLNGYVVQSASNVIKIKTGLSIIDDKNIPIEIINGFLNKYTVSRCLQEDNKFIQLIENKLGNNCLSSIDAYKVGNGNCIFAQSKNSAVSFFYDIGFNCRHSPNKIIPGETYSYYETMKEIYAKKPSFVILSHWDMDHIAGSFAAKDTLFEKDWFAPDYYDACLSAKRLAKYLDFNKHLFLVNRRSSGKFSGRQIGCNIDIKDSTSSSVIRATYKLYIGKKDSCDSSYPNCEGIAIEYTDINKKETILMMGDVNYASFNAARCVNGEPSFARTDIDYLIAPHHGSERTAYTQITGTCKGVKKGKIAIICCTNDSKINRPNDAHLLELKNRFKDVYTTEKDSKSNNSITINF